MDKETFTDYWHHQDFSLHERTLKIHENFFFNETFLVTFVIFLRSEIINGSYLSILRKIENVCSTLFCIYFT
jgi:hypothetical protein